MEIEAGGSREPPPPAPSAEAPSSKGQKAAAAKRKRPEGGGPGGGQGKQKPKQKQKQQRNPRPEFPPIQVEYVIKDGLRSVVPYVYAFTARAKGRWWGKPVLEVRRYL